MLEEQKVPEIVIEEKKTAQEVSDEFEMLLDNAKSKDLFLMAMVAESLEDYP